VIPAEAEPGPRVVTRAGPGTGRRLAAVAGHRPSLDISVPVTLASSLIRSARAKSR
jgi:hypothetical protein